MKGKRPTISLNQVFILAVILFHLTPALPVLCGEPPKDPILRLETGMHTAVINRIGIDEENRYLVTGSDDKTVRIWELPTGRLIRILRPPIGEGYEGRIYAVALSPDGKTVACGGWTQYEGGTKEAKNYHIFLFDRETGVLVNRITGLPNVILHLAYSKDGRFLVVTLGGRANGVRVFDARNCEPVPTDSDDYGDGSYGADFDSTGRLVTASDDGYLRLYRYESKTFKFIKKSKPREENRPFSVSFSPCGTRIAVGYDDSIKVDVLSGGDLSPLDYSPDTSKIDNGDLSKVAWSSDGRFLYAGGKYWKDGYPIVKWSEAGRGSPKEVKAAENTVMDIRPLRRGGIAFGAYDPAFGLINDRDERVLFKGPSIADYRGGYKGLLISDSGSVVQFGYELWGKSPARFSISDRLLEMIDSGGGRKTPGELKPPVISANRLEIDWENTLTPRMNKNPLKLDHNERSRSLAIAPDEKTFLLGAEWSLRLYDRGGKEKWERPVPLPEIAWAVNISGDGRVAVASLGDGTIRWYRMRDGKELLALFPDNIDRKRWVLWTPSGYYDASAGAEELIGWHINKGGDKEADFFPVSRFRSVYYRPDVIEEVLKTLDLDEAVKLANVRAGVKERTKAVREILPPVVEIISPADNSQLATKTLTIRYRVRSPAGDSVTGMRVFVDGGLIKNELRLNLVGADIEREIQVDLPERDCEIGIVTENRHGWGVTAKRRLTWIGPKDEKKGVLYVLAIGVTNYKDEALKKGVKRAADDAKDFAELLKKQKRGRLYRDVQVTTLRDDQVTRDSIIIALRQIGSQATGNDLIMLFVSGHGEKDDSGKYRYLLPDVDKNRLPSRCLSHSDIKDPLVRFPGRRVIFIDTCRSGYIIDVIGFANELASSENGRIIVFTSATGNQNSEEPPGASNGAFTKALLEGLGGKAAGEQRKVTVSRLRVYIEEEVPRLTNNRQTPDFVDLGGGALELAEVID
jgi:WD40 repeat protein